MVNLMNKIATSNRLKFKNASIVHANDVFLGDMTIESGLITSISSEIEGHDELDLDGDYLIPGLIDIHTDHFEKHVYPRPHVKWDFMRAAMAHDAQIIGAGVTTVFDSICVGATKENPSRREILKPMIEALEKAQSQDMLRSEHFIHLRCEITDEETANLTRDNINKDIVRIISVMEHLPGIRQSRDIDGYIERNVLRTGRTRQEIMEMVETEVAAMQDIGRKIRPQIVKLAHEYNMPLLSHDDTEPEHIELALRENVSVSEFPCTIEAARLARKNKMKIVAGAPNLLRGGSQSGNVAVKDLLQESLVDILASDYVPRSMLDCAFKLGLSEEFDISLPEAIDMVAHNPAKIVGFDDRGCIEVGKRADLLQVGIYNEHPFVKKAWRNGNRVF